MEYYKVFAEVIIKEITRFQLDTEMYTAYLNQLTCSLDQNFDVPYNRCVYMFKYGTMNTYFFKDCVKQFLLDSNAKDIFSEWKSHTEVNICSLSVGPGLDYLAFILAISEYDSSPPNFNGAKIIARHGAWRNTIHFLQEALREQGSMLDILHYKLKYENVNVIKADFLTDLSGKFTASLCNAHIVLMVRTLNLNTSGSPEEGPLLQMLKVLLSSLRTDATIFCIDTNPSIALFTQAFTHFSGRFLYGPIHRTTTAPREFIEDFGSCLAVNGRGAFFVWQKLPTELLSFGTSHLNATSVSIASESNLKVAYGNDDHTSDLSDPCPAGNESKIEDKDSVNIPWKELKFFWKSSSPKTKKILKELMLSDKEKLESIGNFISQSEKVDFNTPVNVTQMEMVNGAEQSYSQEPNLQTVKLKNDTKDCSFRLANSNSYDDIVRNLSNETANSENSFINEKMTLPGTIKMNTSVLSNRDKLGNYDTPVKILQSTKTNSNSEEYSSVEDYNASILSHGKAILTDSYESSSSTTIKELSECIKQLASSLDNITQLNDPPNYNPTNCSLNKHHSQNHLLLSGNMYKMPCSKTSTNFVSTEKNNLASSKCVEKKNTLHNVDDHCRCKFCHYQYCLMQLHCQPSCSHVQSCCSLSMPRCSFSCCRQPSREHLEHLTTPNIVIPLHNLNEEALLKIISVLR